MNNRSLAIAALVYEEAGMCWQAIPNRQEDQDVLLDFLWILQCLTEGLAQDIPHY